MGRKNFSGVRRRIKGDNKSPLLIDFRYTNYLGQPARHRQVATVQLWDAAVAEAKRLIDKAKKTGRVDDEPPFAPAGHVDDDKGSASPGNTTTTKQVGGETFQAFVEGDFTALYMPTYRPTTKVRYSALLRQSVGPFFGKMMLTSIGPRQIKEFGILLQKKGVQAKGAVNLVRTILGAAQEEQKIPEFKFPRVFKESKKLPGCCSDEEYAIMLEEPGWVGLATALAGDAGLRQGEVRALEVQDIDFAANKILIRRAYSEDVVLPPKNGDERGVDLTPYLAARLREAVRSKLPRARLVLDESGRTPVRQEVLRLLKKYQGKRGFKKLWSFHSLRHRFCTVLARQGVHVEAIMQLAGHKSIATTLRYIHATAQDRSDAMRKLGEQTARVVSARAVSK